MINFIKTFKKIITILIFILCCTWGITLITIHATSFETPCYTVEYTIPQDKYIPIVVKKFAYEEPKSIEEAKSRILTIKSYIETLELNQKDIKIGYYTSPVIITSLNQIDFLQELIQKYENFINEQKPSYTLIDIGEFKLTAYCPCEECSGPWGSITSTGVTAEVGYTVAVDPSVISYGTKLLIGDTLYMAQDCGGSVKGNIIDIYFATHEESVNFGVQYSQVYIYQE